MYEIELKLQIPKQKKAQIEKAIYALSPQKISLHAQYFDTTDFTLAQHFIAIRLRKEQKNWIQTLKSAGKNALERYENDFSHGESTDVPHLNLNVYTNDEMAQKVLQPIIQHGQYLPLNMQFETVVERSYQVIEYQDSRIEICLDLGHIGNTKHKEDLCEIEFELVSGHPISLILLAQDWVEKYSIWLDIRSKAERGNLIARSLQVSPAKDTGVFHIESNTLTTQAYPQILLHYTQALLPHLAAIADQVAELAHYIQAEKILSYIIYLTTKLNSSYLFITEHRVSVLQDIQQQLNLYLALNNTYTALAEPIKEYQLTHFDTVLTQQKLQLSKSITAKEVTSTVLELLHISFKDQTYFDSYLPSTLWIDELKQKYKTLKKNIKNILSPISCHDSTIITELAILTQYSHKKPYISAKLAQNIIELSQINIIENALENVKISKNEKILIAGWLTAKKSNSLNIYQKQFRKI